MPTDWTKFRDEITHVSYSPEDNKFRFYTADHNAYVSEELFKAFRDKLRLTRAPRQGCYFGTWVPIREDAALALCGEIIDDGLTLEDRAADKHERFATYSDNAHKRKLAAAQASHDATAGIPFGQPILVGHHSEKRHRAAIKKSQDQATKSVKEWKKSTYWSQRAESVLSHAEYKTRPDVILRRIKKLKAEKRKKEKERLGRPGDTWHIERWIGKLEEGPWSDIWLSCEERIALLPDEKKDELNASLARQEARLHEYCDRWIAHLDGQIEYWQTIYDASSGVPADKFANEIEKGGWILCRWGWGNVKRVTRRNGKILSVTLDNDTIAGPCPRKTVVKYDRIRDYNFDGPKKETDG